MTLFETIDMIADYAFGAVHDKLEPVGPTQCADFFHRKTHKKDGALLLPVAKRVRTRLILDTQCLYGTQVFIAHCVELYVPVAKCLKKVAGRVKDLI